MYHPPFVQFETRRAALEAQRVRLVELRDHLRALEELRCSPHAVSSVRRPCASEAPGLSKTT